MSIPNIDFLLETSAQSLQDLEMSALNISANLSKSIKQELHLWVEKYAEAILVRWFLENREDLRPQTEPEQLILFETIDFIPPGVASAAISMAPPAVNVVRRKRVPRDAMRA